MSNLEGYSGMKRHSQARADQKNREWGSNKYLDRKLVAAGWEIMRPYRCLTAVRPTFVLELIYNTTTTWDVQWFREVFLPMECPIVLSIPLVTCNIPDFWCWNFEHSGMFTVKSAYNMLVATKHRKEAWLNGSVASSLVSREHETWRMLRKAQIPTKIRMFPWRLAEHSIPTEHVRTHHNMTPSCACGLCGALDSWRHTMHYFAVHLGSGWWRTGPIPTGYKWTKRQALAFYSDGCTAACSFCQTSFYSPGHLVSSKKGIAWRNLPKPSHHTCLYRKIHRGAGHYKRQGAKSDNYDHCQPRSANCRNDPRHHHQILLKSMLTRASEDAEEVQQRLCVGMAMGTFWAVHLWSLGE